MSKSYDTPAKKTLDLLESVKKKHHQRRVDAEVDVGMIFVEPNMNKHDQPTGAAVSWAGVEVAAKVRLTSVKERLHVKFDFPST